MNGENSFTHFRTDYWQVPEHDEAWVAKQKKDFGETEFAQEFELQFHAASKMLLKPSDFSFIERVGAPFERKYIPSDSPYLNDPDLKWAPDFDPNDVSPSDRFVLLVDLAEGNGDEAVDDTKKKSKTRTPDSNTVQVMKVIANSPANIRRFSESGVTMKDSVRFIQVGT